MRKHNCETCGEVMELSTPESTCYACSIESNLDELASLGSYLAEYDGFSERTS